MPKALASPALPQLTRRPKCSPCTRSGAASAAEIEAFSKARVMRLSMSSTWAANAVLPVTVVVPPSPSSTVCFVSPVWALMQVSVPGL
ncbi:MAG: hypothetical protein E5V78_24560 [Mesorhizobium sp.]|nr:MAG: hypothetical protein E5V78_24560 [Mesorhizobium sp.]